MKIICTVRQSLETGLAATLDEQELEDAIETIKDPDPCLVGEAPEGLSFEYKIKSAEATVEGGTLSATRELLFTFVVTDQSAYDEWCKSNDVDHESDAFLSHLLEDYEGSFVGDDMVDFDNQVSTAVELPGK